MSILAMNQNVFSSIFVGKKVSKEAKRAIEAEMIVLASATRMSYDEMEYVDGGGVVVDLSQVYYSIGVIVGLTLLNGGPAAVKALALSVKSAITGTIAFVKTLLSTMPVVGPLLLIFMGWILKDLPGALFDGFMQGKGKLDFDLKTTWFGLPNSLSITAVH